MSADQLSQLEAELAELKFLYEDGDRQDAQLRQAIRQLRSRIERVKQRADREVQS